MIRHQSPQAVENAENWLSGTFRQVAPLDFEMPLVPDTDLQREQNKPRSIKLTSRLVNEFILIRFASCNADSD